MGQIKPFCGCMFVIPGISDLKNYDQCHECNASFRNVWVRLDTDLKQS